MGYGARDLVQVAIEIGAGDSFVLGAIFAVLMDGGVLHLADLPVAVAIGKQGCFLRVDGVVCALLAAFLRLQGWGEIAVAAGQHHGGFGFFDGVADLFRLLDLALNYLKAAIRVGIGRGACDRGRAAGKRALFFFRYLQ